MGSLWDPLSSEQERERSDMRLLCSIKESGLNMTLDTKDFNALASDKPTGSNDDDDERAKQSKTTGACRTCQFNFSQSRHLSPS